MCTGAEGRSAEDKDSSHEDLHDAGQAGRRLGRVEKRLGNSLLLVSFWDVSCLLFLDALGCGDIKVRGVYGGILRVIMSCELHHPGLPLITRGA